MNNHLLKFAAQSRLYYLTPPAILFLAVSFLTRIALQLAFPDMPFFSGDMPLGLAKGLYNDAATLFFVLLPPAVFLLLPAESFMRKKAGNIYALTIFFVFSASFISTSFAEFFFWDEFHSRFNFIAVDYLIYTTEVLRNIIESYPLPGLLLAVFTLALTATAVLWKALRRLQAKMQNLGQSRLRSRLTALDGLCLAALLIFACFSPAAGSRNRFWNEYAKNGVYELFSAYLNNQLDYRAFYKNMDKAEAFALMRREMTRADEKFFPSQAHGLVRAINTPAPEKTPNVIIVIMESMGSAWMGEYTPNLKALADESLFFNRMMSTGTRTVRGLEAVMLSIPPTPGNSIVRRPDNDRLFNLGTVFRDKGYDLSFIYGGIGFFDNMNAFFAGNGYQVTDKLDFAPENKTFANAWGQCDEDLYTESLAQADRNHAAGRPFQQVLLTTSNHRPFTYPDGKVAIKAGSGRRGAVQYSDYAIGRFLEEARTKPWFDDTVFVFVGDHPSAIAGKTEVPADGYGIICLIYGPRFFKAEKIDTLCSQIDVAPTLLAGLGWNYTSQFFGADARSLAQQDGRAWISTYQLLGFMTNDSLVVLKPDGQAEVTALRKLSGGPADEALTARAVASYQCAYDLFVDKRLKKSAILARSIQASPPSQSRLFTKMTETDFWNEKSRVRH